MEKQNGTGRIILDIAPQMGAKRMKIKDLQEALGVSYPTAHDLYHDRGRTINRQRLAALCQLFDCQPGDILQYIRDEDGEVAMK